MEVLARAFGPLELRVLDVLWSAERPVTVRDLQPSFPGVAYTTLMTTLDRLHKKGLLERTKARRAYAYAARFGRRETEVRLAARTLEGLFGPARPPGALEPILSCFVDAVGERDRLLLDDLERLVRAKRAQLGREGAR